MDECEGRSGGDQMAQNSIYRIDRLLMGRMLLGVERQG